MRIDPASDSFQPRPTPVVAPKKRAPSRGRRRMILAAVAAVLLGIVIGAWIAVGAVQRELAQVPASSSQAGQVTDTHPLLCSVTA